MLKKLLVIGVALSTLVSCAELLRGKEIQARSSDAFYQWTATIGCSEDDRGHAIQAAENGRIFVAGHFAVFADLDPFEGVSYRRTSDRKDDPEKPPTNADLFVIGLDSDETFRWSRQIGPWADGYAIDSGGNQNFAFPDPSDAIPAVLAVDSTSSAFPSLYLAGYYEKVVEIGDDLVYPKYPESFDPVLTPNESTRRIKESKDIFVTKMKQDGEVAWTKTIGSKGEEAVTRIRTDSEGSVYVCGFFGLNWNTGLDGSHKVNFDPATSPNYNPIDWPDGLKPGSTSYQQVASYPVRDTLRGDPGDTGGQAFVWKLNQAGELQWVFTLPALAGSVTRDEETGQIKVVVTRAIGFFDMAVDDLSNVYIGGSFARTVDFDPAVQNTSTTALASLGDAFVAKYDKYGNYQWVVTRGTSGGKTGVTALALAPSGYLYAAGVYNGSDIFIIKLDRDGHDMWRTPTGEGLKRIPGLANRGPTHGYVPDPIGEFKLLLDAEENLYIVGRFVGTQNFKTADMPTSMNDNRTSAGYADVFVSKLNPNGFFEWTVTFGGELYDVPMDASFDGAGNLYITGFFESKAANFNPTGGYDWKEAKGKYDVFITKLRPAAMDSQAK